jgi:uncharacterized membrane protein YphA (DoxX/SURF4 family)
LRLGLGLLLLATGLGKLLDVPGFIDVIGTYQLGLGSAATAVAAWSIVAIELWLGLWLVASRRPVPAAALGAGLNLGYTVLLANALRRGLDLPNCGCFGVFFPSPLTWLSPLESLASAALCALLWNLLRKHPQR